MTFVSSCQIDFTAFIFTNHLRRIQLNFSSSLLLCLQNECIYLTDLKRATMAEASKVVLNAYGGRLQCIPNLAC